MSTKILGQRPDVILRFPALLVGERGGTQTEPSQKRRRLDLFLSREAREGLRDHPGVRRKDAGDECRARRREDGITRATIIRTLLSFHEPLLHETIDQIGDTPARDEDFLLNLAEQQATLVIEHLENGELRPGE